MGLEFLAAAALSGIGGYAASQSQPKPPSASKTAAAQNQQNLFNTQLSQASLMNQSNPFASLTFTPGAIDPATGLPRYSANTQYSPQNQALVNNQYGVRGGIGTGLGGLLGDINLGQAPDLSTAAGSLTNQMLDRHLSYMEPYFARQDNALQNRLNVQGASDNARSFAEMEQGDNRARNIMQAINTFEPMAFSQALQNYQTPINTISQLFNLSNPMDPNFAQTPTFQQTAPNMGQLAQNQFMGQSQNYQNLMSGLGQLGSSIANFPLGTAPGAVPTVGSKIGQGISSMFS